jgi:hypothetical protein
MQVNTLTVTLLIVAAALVSFVVLRLISRQWRKSNSPAATFQNCGHFLVLDHADGRHIVVLKKAMIDSLGSSAGAFNATAATTAGILYSMRSGEPVAKADASRAGDEVASIAVVSHFNRLSELFQGNAQIPEGWGSVPVVVVSWTANRK